jgi:hypothetical protein
MSQQDQDRSAASVDPAETAAWNASAPRPQPAGDDPRPARARRSDVPDRDACLGALGRLPGLMMMGLVTTPQANALRAIYGTILQQHDRARDAQGGVRLADANVLQLARTDPALLGMLEPLLTDQQIHAVMHEARACAEGEGGEGVGDGQA